MQYFNPGVPDGSVTTAKLANNAVTAAKIADNTITTSQMAASGVTAGTYKTSEVTVDASGLVTAAAGAGLQLTIGTPITLNPFVAGHQANGTHGLGATPNDMFGYLECLTAELGYSIGDRVILSSSMVHNVAAEESFWGNSTNWGYSTNSTSNPVLCDKASSSVSTITAANWKLVTYPMLWA